MAPMPCSSIMLTFFSEHPDVERPLGHVGGLMLAGIVLAEAEILAISLAIAVQARWSTWVVSAGVR